LLIEKSSCIHYWTPPSWFHAVNCLEAGLQGLIHMVSVLQMEWGIWWIQNRFRCDKWNTPLICIRVALKLVWVLCRNHLCHYYRFLCVQF